MEKLFIVCDQYSEDKDYYVGASKDTKTFESVVKCANEEWYQEFIAGRTPLTLFLFIENKIKLVLPSFKRINSKAIYL